MTPQSARTIVLLTGGFLFAMIALRRQNIDDPFRYAWAAGVITLGLSAASDIAPEVAGPFAILLLIAVWWKHKGVVGSALPSSSAQKWVTTKPTGSFGVRATSPTGP